MDDLRFLRLVLRKYWPAEAQWMKGGDVRGRVRTILRQAYMVEEGLSALEAATKGNQLWKRIADSVERRRIPRMRLPEWRAAAAALLDQGLRVRSSLADKCAPQAAALVIVDMLNDFVHPRGSTALNGGRSVDAGRAAIGSIRELARAARSAGVPVVYIQHSTPPDHGAASGPWLDARRRAVYSGPDICLDGTWGQQVVEELAPQQGDTVVKKHRYSGFAGTGLDGLLRERGRETIVVCGVSTNVCVESTARQGFDLDYYVVIPEDACGSWDARLHEAALMTARSRYAAVCRSSEVVSIWQDHPGRIIGDEARAVNRSRISFAQSWDRGVVAPPGGGSVIVHVVVNLELWPFDAALPRSLLPAPHGEPRIPDVPNYSWVEYGLRCGLPRLLRLFDEMSVPVAASVNAGLFEAEPAIGERILEAGWELVGHGTEQRSLAAGSERKTIRRTLDILEGFSGTRPRGWLSPGLQETFDTPDLLAEAGVEYVLDWAVDDLPVWMDTRSGPLLAVPYSLEINDSLLFGVEKHPPRELAVRVADTLAAFESELASNPRILTLGLHPHLIGVPHRFVYLERVLGELTGRSDTVFMTGANITDWYRTEAPPPDRPTER